MAKQKQEIEDIKQPLNFMSGELTTVTKQLKVLMDLMDEIKEVKRQNMKKDQKVSVLEKRLDDLEQYSRINDLTVSGLQTKPRSYARVETMDALPMVSDIESLEQQVINYLGEKGIQIQTADIEACHPLSRKKKKENPDIILRFVNRRRKVEVLKQGHKLRGSNVYLNEHLTRKNANIARQVRVLRKEKKIQATWTTNCKIYIKLNGTPEEAKTLLIGELLELDQYV